MLQSTFRFQSDLWVNKNAHNPGAASGGLDTAELKSKAYWGVAITKGLCLGMRGANDLAKYIQLPYNASSLHSVIADDKPRNASLGEAAWKSFINGSYLHGLDGSDEGFNVNDGGALRARIGVASNAPLPNAGLSVLGFGISRAELSCGNFALTKRGGFGTVKLTAFGSILVQ